MEWPFMKYCCLIQSSFFQYHWCTAPSHYMYVSYEYFNYPWLQQASGTKFSVQFTLWYLNHVPCVFCPTHFCTHHSAFSAVNFCIKFWRFADHASQYIYLSNQQTWCTKFLFYNKFISCLYMFRACAHHQEVKIALHSLWYHHTYTINLL